MDSDHHHNHHHFRLCLSSLWWSFSSPYRGCPQPGSWAPASPWRRRCSMWWTSSPSSPAPRSGLMKMKFLTSWSEKNNVLFVESSAIKLRSLEPITLPVVAICQRFIHRGKFGISTTGRHPLQKILKSNFCNLHQYNMQLEYILVGYSWTKSVEQDSYKSQHGMVTVWSNSVRSGRHQAQGKSQVLFTRPYSSEFQVLSNTRHQEK